MIKHFFLRGHWIKALLRDYWFGIKENRTNKKLSGCCQRKCQTPESWERIDEDFLSGIEPPVIKQNKLIISQGSSFDEFDRSR